MAGPAPVRPHQPGMASGLQRRLLLLLLVPLLGLALLSTWFDYRSAGNAALQQDRQLIGLVPLLAASVVAAGAADGEPPLLLMAPPVRDFLNERVGASAFAIVAKEGSVVLGEAWLSGMPPATNEPEFASQEYEGVVYRIVSQRVLTAGGEWVLRLADGSDSRQQWLRLLWLKVALPNLVLVVVALFAVNWAVSVALRPLLALKDAVQRRSPRDLSPLDTEQTPTEVRPLVDALNQLFALVEAQAESQRRFVADAAHQLRTPLAGLQAQVEAWAQALYRRAGPSDTPDWLYRESLGTDVRAPAPGPISLDADQILKLRQAVRRTSQLANQLLALSRADARSANTQSMARVDLSALCETLLEMHLDAAAAKSIDLGLECAHVHATGHEWLLRELLGNLVDNAIRYTPHGGRVTVRCGWAQPNGQTACPYLEVEDNGPGVVPSERARMLERFYRVPGTSGEGSGLGLAIAAEIARVHHSNLTIADGRDGCGLRIGLVLPV